MFAEPNHQWPCQRTYAINGGRNTGPPSWIAYRLGLRGCKTFIGWSGIWSQGTELYPSSQFEAQAQAQTQTRILILIPTLSGSKDSRWQLESLLTRSLAAYLRPISWAPANKVRAFTLMFTSTLTLTLTCCNFLRLALKQRHGIHLAAKTNWMSIQIPEANSMFSFNRSKLAPK